MRCPLCGYDLRGTIAQGGKRCPRCDRRFRLTELGRPIEELRLREENLRCPGCAYDLRGTIAHGLKRCPECGRRFRLSEFESRQDHDLRITGRYLVILILVWFVAVVAILWWMLVRPMLAM